MTDDEPTDDEDEGQTRERVQAFVDSIEDVSGVTASVRGVGNACYATVAVDHDYGNRDEFGDGVVGLAPDSDDPVGREAYNRDMEIVKAVPLPDGDRTRYSFATDTAVDQSVRATTIAKILGSTGLNGEVNRLVKSVVRDEFGVEIVDAALDQIPRVRHE